MGLLGRRNDGGDPTAKPRLDGALLLFAFVAAAISFAIYIPGFDGDYVFDDRKLILGNEELWRPNEPLLDELGYTFNRLGGIFRAEEETAVRTAFRPVRFASMRIDVRLARAIGAAGEDGSTPEPWIFHAHNALIHALNVLLLAFLVRAIRPDWTAWAAALFALIFGVHPIHTESVTYISGRRDVLFLTFVLLAALVYVRGRADGGWWRGLAIAGLSWLALGTKEMAVTLPVALLFIEGMAPPVSGDRAGWRRIVDRAPLVAPALIAAGLFALFLLTRQNPGGGTGWWGGSMVAAFFGSGRAIVTYLQLLVWPHPLSVDYSFDAFPASTGPFTPWTGIASWLLLLSLVVAAWRMRKTRPALASSILLFFVLISPVAQWIPHPERFAEHHLYYPSLAFFAAGAALLGSLLRKNLEGTVGGVLVAALVCGSLTVSRLDDWSSPYTLWRSAAEAYPRCARAHFGWGNAAQQEGRSAEAVKQLGVAIDLLAPIEREPLQQGYYLQALQIRSGILASLGTQDDAIIAKRHLDTLLELNDSDGTPLRESSFIWTERMKLSERLGDRAEALTAAQTILQLDANAAERLEARLFVAAALSERGENDRAEETLVRAMTEADTNRERARIWYQLGVTRSEQKNWAAALEAFENAAEQIGPDGRRESALYKAAECALQLGSVKEARRRLEELLEIKPGHLPALLSLAEILLGAGELEDAEKIFVTVLDFVPDEPRAQQGLVQARARQKMKEKAPAQVEDPTRVRALAMLADRLEAEGKFDEAIDAVKKAEKHAEGPAQLEARLSLRWRLAQMYVQAGYRASRQENEVLALAQLTLAKETYAWFRELAPPETRGKAATEAAQVLRATDGRAAAQTFLQEEWAAGVTEPRVAVALFSLGVELDDDAEANRWAAEILKLPEDAVRAEVRQLAEEQVSKEKP